MSELPNFDQIPRAMYGQSRDIVHKIDPSLNLERELLAGYDGSEAAEKEKLFRNIVACVYYEAYVAGSTGAVPDSFLQEKRTIIEDEEGERND